MIPLDRWPDKTRKLPYGLIGVGYKQDPEDPHHIIPDEDQIVHIEQAFDYIDSGNSLREVQDWLSQKLSRSIVHQTIANLYNRHRKPWMSGKKSLRKLGRGRKHSPDTKKLTAAKTQATMYKKRAERIEAELKSKRLETQKNYSKTNLPHLRDPEASAEGKVDKSAPVPNDVNFVFRPNPGPQTSFLSATEQEVLYGGAAGGEPKTWFSASFHSNVSK